VARGTEIGGGRAAGNVLRILRDRDAEVRVFDLPIDPKRSTK